jgi:hypothetical protein
MFLYLKLVGTFIRCLKKVGVIIISIINKFLNKRSLSHMKLKIRGVANLIKKSGF